jgi:hypothetical protein
MRFTSFGRVLLLSAFPLAAASCVSAPPPPDPGSPVPAQLSDRQASFMAREYLSAHNVSAPRALVGEQKQPRGWWMWYQGPFDPQAKPPQGSYLVEVDNDGTVRDID